jgi:response regulator RpfG family c-di-GMP phosphodiesterase
MGLFSKKKTASSLPVQPPPVVVAPPSVVKNDSVLKLDLPDIFAYDNDATKAKVAQRRPGLADDDEKTDISVGTIVLVESDDEVRRLISRLLQNEGYEIVATTCLAEARAILKETPAEYLLARRACVPVNLQTELVLRDLMAKTKVRIVDEFNELLLGQVVDYEAMSQCQFALLDLLMSLLEGAHVGVRGHAHSVAKYCRLVGQRVGLSRWELDAVTVAALLHDLGSIETRQQIGEPLHTGKELLPATVRSTLEMLGNVTFPYNINDLISTAATLDIAANAGTPPSQVVRAAHVLRVADAYDSLRRTQKDGQSEDDVFEELRRQAAGTFDTDILETFIHIRKHERTISQMNIFWAAVLLVDPHPEDLKLLQMRLENDDFHVVTARSVEEAVQKLRNENITLVVTEHKLDGRGDGFELLRTMRSDPSLRQIPVVFHASAETDLVKYALELGAEDWLPKPHNVEIMAMKLHRIVGRMHSSAGSNDEGVRGHLRDMGIIELVQVLSSGNRSVQIVLETGKNTGELVLDRGQIVAASRGDATGEAAALELLGWEEGQFRILPLRQKPPVTIRSSTDNLILQSCYLKDSRNNPEKRGLAI